MNSVSRYALAGIAVGLFCPAVSVGAPVAIVSQDRLVHMRIPSIDPLVPGIDEFARAPDDNPFDAALDRTLSQMGETNSAFASQNSSFGNAGNVFSASGTGRARYTATGLGGSVENVSAGSEFEVVFTLAESRLYSLSGSASFVDLMEDESTRPQSNFAAILFREEGNLFIESFDSGTFSPGNQDGAVITSTFSGSGTLPAGTYKLHVGVLTDGGPPTNENVASFEFDFTATAPGDDGGGNPIPLPAAVWPAGALLLGVIARSARAHRAGAGAR
jgi:hypothetical protein